MDRICWYYSTICGAGHAGFGAIAVSEINLSEDYISHSHEASPRTTDLNAGVIDPTHLRVIAALARSTHVFVT
jgi:hypothetical protein